MSEFEYVHGKRGEWDRRNGWNKIYVDTLLITENQLHPYIQYISRLKGTPIKTAGPIYFQKEAVFPRDKLKEIVENPVTRSLEKAEYVVINKSHLLSLIDKGYYKRYWKQSDNTWLDDYSYITPGTEVIDCKPGDNDHRNFKIIEKIDQKKIIFDDYLSSLVPRNIEVAEDRFNSIQRMLSCSDKQSIKVGIQILCQLDYKRFETEVLLLLNKNIENIRRWQCQHIVLFKSLIKTVERDYPDWDTPDKLKFTLALLERNQKNSVALQYINEYFNDIHKLSSGSYQISIIEQQIAEKLKENELDLQGKKV